MSAGSFRFHLETRCSRTHARAGSFQTPHGSVDTPAFMPVGTRGTVKGVFPRDLAAAGARMILANTYHLHLRPGEETVERLGGLHRFMNWDGPILTDSGGYQVFSLEALRKIDADGVDFSSVVDGARVRFTAERVVDIQRKLGADVIMAFDHCPSDPGDRSSVLEATERTHRWLERCVRRWREFGACESGQALFGIVQGGSFDDLRRASVEAVCAHDLPGYAVGGVGVGEAREEVRRAIGASLPILPADRPRYLMGVGTPLDFYEAVGQGADLFDCVTPTRHARNHLAYTSTGRINLRNSAWKEDPRPLDASCVCPACKGWSRGTLRHLCMANEMLAGMLLSLHNLWTFHGLLAELRAAVQADRYEEMLAARIEPMCVRLDA
jgi:queuine tRNA-ribosyltransferase